MASLLESNKAFKMGSLKHRIIYLTVLVIIAALSLHGCVKGKSVSPTFGRDVKVFINPTFANFTPEDDVRELTGKEKQNILDWYEQIIIIEGIDNPATPTESPVPSIMIVVGDWKAEHKANAAFLTNISGEYFYMTRVLEGMPTIYLGQQDNIKALFNQLCEEYKPNTTP